MIDNDLRIRRLFQEAQDKETALIILDVVIGFGAHSNPAGELAPAISKAKNLAKEEGRNLVVIASVTGTEDDPQKLSKQEKQLKDVGVVVLPSNASAARLTARIINALNEKRKNG